MKPSPVAIFAFNRPCVFRTISFLESNRLARDTHVYVFCDGGRNDAEWQLCHDIRRRLRELKPRFASFTVVDRDSNVFINKNMEDGLRQVFQDHDRVIVVEDDLDTSPFFLDYMNDALERYASEKRVMSVCGFSPIEVPEKGDVYLSPHFAGWGWATWADRWQHYRLLPSKGEALAMLSPEQRSGIEYGGAFRCLHHLDTGRIDWDLSWLIAIRSRGGLCLYPTQTLVHNSGTAGGTHFRDMSLFGHYEYDRHKVSRRRHDVALHDIAPDPDIENLLLPEALRDHGFRYNLLGRVVRRIYKLLTNGKYRS